MSPDLLPSISDLRRVTQSLAMLDAILSPEWEYRYYSFNCQWAPQEEMASMRDGSGDEWFLLLDSAGAAIKGFAHELAHESPIASEIHRQVPKSFATFLSEPAFSMQNATFCYWRGKDETVWKKVAGATTEDGSSDMLTPLIAGPSGYKSWAEEYFEMPVSLEAVAAIFSHQPLTPFIALALNPDVDMDSVYEDAAEIGYPCDKGE